MNIKLENWKLLVLSVFYVVFAILTYTIPQEKFIHFFFILGIVICFVGFLQIVAYFFKKDYLKPNEFSFAFGVLSMIAGLIVSCKPELIVSNYPIVISCLVVLDSTLRLQYSMNLVRMQDRYAILNIVLAALPLVFGMYLVLVPLESVFLHNCFSFLLIFDAIANFYTVLYYKKIVKRYGMHQGDMIDFKKNKEIEEK